VVGVATLLPLSASALRDPGFCDGCHGEGGRGDAHAGIPRLAGLPARYLERQLEAFRSGERTSPLMSPVAELLGPEDGEALAGHYAALPTPPAAVLPAGSGKRLARSGDPTRGLAPCDACHAPAARLRGEDIPVLVGQPARYLARQLRAWRSGRRGRPGLGPMPGIAAKLSEAEIESVAAYYAGVVERE